MTVDVSRSLVAVNRRGHLPGGPRPLPRRVATLSVHTSPLDQPGTGDAGGMNVYVVEVARRLAALGIEVEIFTRATSSDLPPVVEMVPGVLVRHVTAGPYEGLAKEELPAQLCAFAREVLRAEAAREPGWYDVVHSHYWLSGQVGWLAKDRWGVPLVASMHTLAKVKNSLLADGDAPEPASRVLGEEQVVAAADRLVANTDDEARDLVRLYDADPDRLVVVNPGVDLSVFSPGPTAEARARLGLPRDADVLLFVGRIQPLKAPDVLLQAAARLVERQPARRRRLVVAVVGGPSGSAAAGQSSEADGLAVPAGLRALADSLGIADIVQFHPPAAQDKLADWYRAATVTVVPSYSESFGLVAVESQACGTPVLAASVGGLRTAVDDEVSGVLVDGHDPGDYADVIGRLLDQPRWREGLAGRARGHAAAFGWSATAASTVETYAAAMAEAREPAGLAAAT